MTELLGYLGKKQSFCSWREEQTEPEHPAVLVGAVKDVGCMLEELALRTEVNAQMA